MVNVWFGTRRKTCDEDRIKDAGGRKTVGYRTAAGDGNVDCDAGMGVAVSFDICATLFTIA